MLMRPYGQQPLCLDISLPPRLRVQRLGYAGLGISLALLGERKYEPSPCLSPR